ncbi:EAL domain-containing protein [bacterium RCC_150]
MSTQKHTSLALTNAGTRASPAPSGSPRDDSRALRAQVLEIIDEVLSDSSAATAEVREQLRAHVAAHPGRPEEALLEHLTALRPEQADAASHDASARETAAQALAQQAAAEASEGLSAASAPAAESGPSRVESILRDRMLMTAFQPIYDLAAGTVVGAEALTRFVSDGGDLADNWFAEAEDTGLRTDLEFAALDSALRAAMDLPADLYVALKLSHAAFLDPRMPEIVHRSPMAPDRLVLEISGSFAPEQAPLLEKALAPLRSAGVRLSIDHGGSYFDSVGHILRLKPEMIKLDPGLTAKLDEDTLRQELVEAEVAFARESGAVLTAQRIENAAELAAVVQLGVRMGQGYHLGRPSVRPREWATWRKRAERLKFHAGRGRAGRD